MEYPNAVSQPKIVECSEVNHSSPIHVVCSLPVHFLIDVKSELEKYFHVSHCYNMPRSFVESIIGSADALLVNGAAPYRIDKGLMEKVIV